MKPSVNLSFLVKKITFIATLLLFFFSNCSKKNDLTKKIVLQIGDYKVSQYEFEIQKDKLEKHSQKPSKENFNKWLSFYIDNCYFLAEAYSKKYDTCKIYRLREYYTELDMCSSVGSYYWNKEIEPSLRFSNKDIREAYKRKNKIYNIEYMVFANSESLNSVLKHSSLPRNEVDFKNFSFLYRGINKTGYGSLSLSWPFSPLNEFKDSILVLKPGQVTQPLSGTKGIVIICLNKNGAH
jgi:hypothetical protein